MGRPAKTWPLEQIAAWVAEGKTMRWIAEQIGTCDQQISRLCRANNIPVHRRGPRPGPGNSGWKGGRKIDPDGYVLVWVENHPHARRPSKRVGQSGYVLEHRLVMEAHLGRYLRPDEVVHHRNGVNDDNRIENLEVYASNAEHLASELAGKRPKWSDDGRARIVTATARRHLRQGHRLSPTSRQLLEPDAPTSPETTPR